MVKPATVEQERTHPTRRQEKHRLHLVEIEVAKPVKKAERKPEPKKPEVADDLDDMWDNVPV